MDTVKIGKYIAEHRKAAGLTQQELADQLSVTNKAVSKWETGQGAPDIGLLTELARILHITADELLRGEDNVPSSDRDQERRESCEAAAERYSFQFAVTRKIQLLSARLYWQEIHLPLRLLSLFAGTVLVAASIASAGYAHLTSRSVPTGLTAFLAVAGIALFLLFAEGYRFLNAFRQSEDGVCSVRLMDDSFSVSRDGTGGTWRYSLVTKLSETSDLLTVFCGREAVFLWKNALPAEQWGEMAAFLREHCAGAKYEAAPKKNLKRRFGFLFACAALLVLLFQGGYLFLHAKYDVAYQTDSILYLINFAGLLLAFLACLLLAEKGPTAVALTGVFCVALAAVDIVCALLAVSKTQDILSTSPDGQNRLILKREISTGKTVQYHDPFLCFARPSEQFSYTVSGTPKIQWLTGDTCAVTYTSEENGPSHQMVATFGSRGRNDYYYVEAALDGSWEPSGKNTAGWKLVRDTAGIVLSNGSKEYRYSTKDCVQYGLTTIVLCKDQSPQWTVTLNQDCKIDQKTLQVSYGGTLTLCQVSMNPTAPIVMRSTSKLPDSSEKSVQTSDKDTYRVRDGVLSFSWDYGHRWTALNIPGSEIKSLLKNGSSTELVDGCWYVSDYLSYVVFGRAPLSVLFTPDQGKTWETYQVAASIDDGIESRYVSFPQNGVGAVAVGLHGTHDYKGSLLYTTSDGGKTWQNRKCPSTETLTGMSFLSPEIGYLSYTNTAGDHGELYETTDGGKTFTKVILPAGDLSETGSPAASGLTFGEVYDTPQVPQPGNGIPVLYVTQGSDGDFGTWRARYESKDSGKTWRYVDQEKTPQDDRS